MKDGKAELLKYFSHNDLLLCNINNDLPSIEDVGGDWNSIAELMEQGQVFYSKLYKGRVTYISPRLYYVLKPYKQRVEIISEDSCRILQFVRSAGLATTEEIKNAIAMPKKDFDKAMDGLFKELLLTVIKRDKILTDSWTSFCWGGFEEWEKICPIVPNQIDPLPLLREILTERQIKKIIGEL